MGQIDVNNVLSQMRQLGAQASFPTSATAQSIGSAQGSDFGSLLKQSLAAVADTATGGVSSLITQSLSAVAGAQNDAQTKVDAFERGDAGSDIGSTVIAGQKADLAFRSLVQVRNKLTDAYSTIMNMPV